jgi:steroid delta-isomerase-like uncharacterized protein
VSEENKALVLSLYERVINTGELDRAHELLAPDFAEHEEVPVPAHLTGVEAFEEFFSMIRSAFPDLRMDVLETIAEGDRVVARVSVRGTHRGEFAGVAPTDNRIEVSAIDVFRLEGGKIAEHWGRMDEMGMMRQLGVVP